MYSECTIISFKQFLKVHFYKLKIRPVVVLILKRCTHKYTLILVYFLHTCTFLNYSQLRELKACLFYVSDLWSDDVMLNRRVFIGVMERWILSIWISEDQISFASIYWRLLNVAYRLLLHFLKSFFVINVGHISSKFMSSLDP